MSTNQVSIVEGGSKLDLFAQLMDIGRYLPGDREPFGVTLQHPTLIGKGAQAGVGIFINAVAVESGSGISWNIRGYIPTRSLKLAPWLRHFGFESDFSGYYDTAKRTGWLMPA